MSEESKETKTLVEKMRANTEQGQRKVWAKPYRQSRKKVPKARHKKAWGTKLGQPGGTP